MFSSSDCLINLVWPQSLNDSPLDLAAKLEFEGAAIPQAAAQIQNLYKLFAGVDATQVEVSRHSP